ncbi:head-tail connector protein [Clostridium massiliamazoniense]|uniref:head-tail connector protein n=1 Tax=Clostridium massiliamazoniense TaxID=1347366 RepID=UPI0006D7DF5E|nr:head-tail connector protein [Clostridium massiliamazoniense]
MELNIVKNYLRIDFEEHDKLLELLISVAKEYIEDAIGKYDNTRKNKLFYYVLLLAICMQITIFL